MNSYSTSLNACLLGLFATCGIASAQAVVEADSFDLIDGIDLVDGGGDDDSFEAEDILRLGLSMSRSGDTIVLGNLMRSDDDSGSLPRGSVVTLRRDGAYTHGWKVSGIFNQDDLGPAGADLEVSDEYGYDVKVDGNIMFVSSRRYDEYDTTSTPVHVEDDPGAVFVYTRPSTSSDTWSHFQTIYDPSPVDGERFGHSIDYHDGTLVIAAQRGYIPETRPNNKCGIMGEVHIYEDTGTSGAFEIVVSVDWSDIEPYRSIGGGGIGDSEPYGCSFMPPIPDDASGRGYGFGKQVAIDGDWIIASTEVENEVAVFYRDSGSWGLHSFLDAGSDQTGDWGTSIAISTGRIAVSAKKYPNSFSAPSDGLISLFVYDSVNDEWVNTDNVSLTSIADVGTNEAGLLGRSIVISGDLLLASTQNQSNDTDYAEIYSFVIDPADDTIVPAGRVFYEGYGNGTRVQFDKIGMVVDDDRVIVGDIKSFNSSTNWNKLRVFRSCVADLDEDGNLDSDDSDLFVTLFSANDERADFAKPFGTWNVFDVFHFTELYNLGCP